MEPIKTDYEGRRASRYVRGLATISLLLNCSAVAFGASSFGIECDRTRSDGVLTGNETADLALSTVDLADSQAAQGIDAPLNGASASEIAAPLLFLGPRVASIVEDVFGKVSPSGNETGYETGNENPGVDDPGGSARRSAMTPVAETAVEPEEPQASESDAVLPLDARPTLPRLQREMYRTDI